MLTKKRKFFHFIKKQPPDVFCKKKITILTGKHLCWSLFLIKLQVFMSAALWKSESCTDVFLWILQSFKNNYFEEHPRSSASVLDFLVNALRAGFIRLSFENTLSLANLPVPLLKTFLEHLTETFFFISDNIIPMKQRISTKTISRGSFISSCL